MAEGSRISRQDRQRELKRLGAIVRDIRRDAGLRQVDLADRLGKPQAYVARVEGGHTRVDLYELRQICRATGTKLASVVRRFERSG